MTAAEAFENWRRIGAEEFEKYKAGKITKAEYDRITKEAYALYRKLKQEEEDAGNQEKEKAVKELEKDFRKIYGTAATELKGTLSALEKDYAEALNEKRKQLTSGEISKSEFDDWVRGRLLQQDIVKQKIDQCTGTLLHANEKALAAVNGQQLRVFAENANFQQFQIDKDVGMNLMFSIHDETTVEKLIREKPDLLPPKKVNEKKDKAWNQGRIINAVTQAIIQGDSIPTLARRIAAEYAGSNADAMMRYARTAMTSAQNAGRQEMLHNAKELGIKCKKTWLATLDHRTRDSHAKLDGQTVDVDAHFHSDLGEILFPGDPSAHPGDVYNCRCTMVYEYEGFPNQDDYRLDNETGELIQDMTYQDWKKMNQPDKPEPSKPEKTDLEKKVEKAVTPDSLETIMKKINDLEQAGEYEDEKKNLLPLGDKALTDEAHKLYMSIPEAEREALAKVTEIEIKKLKTEQAEVFTPRLEELAEAFDGRKVSGARTEDFDGITVAKFKGEYIVLDGNNRTNLAILKGQDKLDVMMVDLDEIQQKQKKPDAVQELKDMINGHKGTWTEEELRSVGKKAAAAMDDIRREKGYYENQWQVEKAKAEADKIWERTSKLHDEWRDANGKPDAKEKWDAYKAEYDNYKNAQTALKRAEKMLDEHDASVLELLKRTRDVGSFTDDDADDLMDASGVPKKTREKLIEAFNHYPREWAIQSAENWLTLKPQQNTGRAYYNFASGHIKIDDKDKGTNIHELAHRFEKTVPGILKAEKEFYERRTAGEESKWLGKGYDSNEKTKKDSFIDKYMGKDYNGNAYELCSMGFELAFTNYKKLCKDEDYRDFILGILCGV